MQFVPNAAQWHKLWSMRFSIATTFYCAAAGAWAVLPLDWKPELTHTAKMILAGVGVMLPACAAVSRMIAQPKLAEDTDDRAHS